MATYGTEQAYLQPFLQAPGAHSFGLQEIQRLLMNRGKTDPRALNMNLAAVDRGAQSAQDATAGRFARTGLSGSVVGQAIQAAQGQGGMALKGRLKAEDAARADENQRMNLQALYNLVIGPGLEMYGLQKGLKQQERERRSNRNIGYASALGSIIPG